MISSMSSGCRGIGDGWQRMEVCGGRCILVSPAMGNLAEVVKLTQVHCRYV